MVSFLTKNFRFIVLVHHFYSYQVLIVTCEEIEGLDFFFLWLEFNSRIVWRGSGSGSEDVDSSWIVGDLRAARECFLCILHDSYCFQSILQGHKEFVLLPQKVFLFLNEPFLILWLDLVVVRGSLLYIPLESLELFACFAVGLKEYEDDSLYEGIIFFYDIFLIHPFNIHFLASILNPRWHFIK